MIIQLRGTSGSGKSTIVRAVMASYDICPQFIVGRKQPIGYELHDRNQLLQPVYLIGHYETPCGGCDTISVPGTIDYLYDTIRTKHTEGFHVLFEGLIVESDVKRCIQLSADTGQVLVIGLTTPVEDCLQGIRNRREARGDDRPLNPDNTVNRIPQIESRMKRLQAAGVPAVWLSREAALETTLSRLGW